MILDILEEKDKNVFLTAQVLEQYNNELLTDSIICEKLSLSKYKVESCIDELNGYQLKGEISINKNSEIVYSNITMNDLERLKNELIRRSKKFKLLHYIVQEGSNIKIFAKEEYLSLPQAYRKRQELNAYLYKEFGIKIEGMSLKADSELHIRNMLNDIYFFYFSGFPPPFSKKVCEYSNTTKTVIMADLQNRITKTLQEKLVLFLSIQYCRAKNSYAISYKDDEFIKSIVSIDRTRVIKVRKHLYKNGLSDTEQYLLDTYIFLGGYKKNITIQPQGAVIYLIDRFQDIFNNYFGQAHLYADKTRKKLTILFSNWFIFSSMATSFIDEFQINYFSEMFPTFHAIAFEFVDKHCRVILGIGIKNSQLVKFYYDIIFMLVDNIPVKEIEPLIKVCIDFSHGESYNSFIERNIEYYKDLNIEFQRFNDTETDLYLTDIYQPLLLAKQIIWRDPPTKNDWAYFADIILELKRDKIEKET